MSLTIGSQPLGSIGPRTVNYRLDGPKHRLLFDPFPRRVRAYLGSELVLDTCRGMLLHESTMMVQLYVPEDDVRAKLTPTDHTTHCPFKGDASYWTVTAGERTAENAVWSYPEPIAEASWLRGYVAVYWTAMDAWFDEDEEIHAHLRDPYHRVDVRRTSRHVQVSAHGQPIAQTRRALLVSETALPNRYYLPLHDVPAELLEVSPTHTYCPLQGTRVLLHRRRHARRRLVLPRTARGDDPAARTPGLPRPGCRGRRRRRADQHRHATSAGQGAITNCRSPDVRT
jgi:uncharacterized protein (DUF427 family)